MVTTQMERAQVKMSQKKTPRMAPVAYAVHDAISMPKLMPKPRMMPCPRTYHHPQQDRSPLSH